MRKFLKVRLDVALNYIAQFAPSTRVLQVENETPRSANRRLEHCNKELEALQERLP